MLKCIFVGSPNRFTELIVHWLSKNCQLQGVVWTYSAHWAKTVAGRMQFAKKRLRRFGALKTLNESLYYLLSKNLLNETGEPFQSKLCDAYARNYGYSEWHGDAIETNDINSVEVLQFVRQRSPDLIMSMCINEFFRKEIRGIPRLGAFLWHEGLVPEYKGLYSPFWTIHNGEPEKLGYSVLRMNGQYDDGEVFLQGLVTDADPVTESPVYIGHKAILDSLPGVSQLFAELENGTAKPISLHGRTSQTYTYPGLTAWTRYRSRVRALHREKGSTIAEISPVPVKSLED